MTTTAETYANLTPADLGIIAVVLDDCAGEGDDDSTETLCQALAWTGVAANAEAARLAYHIVHVRKRRM